MKLLDFDEAIDSSNKYTKRHLLLGNGFSIDCRPDIFDYGKLFEQADFSQLSSFARNAFDALKTTDFERVIKTLKDASKLSKVYGVSDTKTNQMRIDADKLKDLLVETIAASHPALPSDIADSEYQACRKFLRNFDTTYSLNYDLLLYWTFMQDVKDSTLPFDDGFRTSQEDVLEDMLSGYVVWDPGQSRAQSVWFLHGALHIFDSEVEVQKYTWNRTGIRLIEQTREALSKDLFPLFVAEGTSTEKLDRIRHSDYLAKAYRSFQSIQNCLFIHGHSLSENDEHYINLIEQGKMDHVYVGLHGNASSKSNKSIMRRANQMADNRTNKKLLSIDFYDSSSAKVWGK